ncbi:MAG: carbon monoxide dehydrogenase [Thermomicrobiales bacterium]|nr:MAG: carbon monoxide dehydrogenase [Thermomicrobiales bacterium]
MNPAPFTYHRAQSLAEAQALLQRFGEAAKLLAGGHSLLPAMKLRLAQPDHLIDISGMSELRFIHASASMLRIGALTTHREIEQHPLVREHCPLLAETAAVIGDRQVRNRGTIGGALAHADPAADYPAAVLALEATIVAEGPDGRREIPASEFFTGLLTTALTPREIVTEVHIPVLPARTGTSYVKLANPASGFAITGVAALISLDSSGRCTKARVGITGAGAVPTRARSVEWGLENYPLDEDIVTAASRHATDGIDFLSDIHASADYRRRVTIGLTKRAILTALDRAERA